MADETKNQTADSSSPPEQEQPFLSHLIELRDRLMRMVMVLGVLFLGLLYFANDLYALISRPVMKYLPNGKMLAIDVITALFANIDFVCIATH